MAPKLKNNLQVWKLATDLGLKPKDDPLVEILRYCRARIRSFLGEFPCKTLSELLEVAGAKLDTVFIEIHSDEELRRVKMEFLEKGETAFALLDKELAEEVYAITFKRQFIRNGERLYVSLIDCRGEKKSRRYFSKWHELAHLLTLTQQMRLKFCRTHAKSNTKDPEEAVMDAIAGEIGFFPNFLSPYTKGKVSFDKIREVREALCPDASFQAAVIAFVKTWQSPCLLVVAGLGWRKREEATISQDVFDFVVQPVKELRALQTSSNEMARKIGLFVPRNMRIPKKSIIWEVFSNGLSDGQAIEDLSWWEDSSGQSLEPREVFTMAAKNGGRVLALIVPAK